MAIQLEQANEAVPLVVALDAVDAEAPLRDVTSEQRRARVRQLFEDTLRSAHPVRGAINIVRELGRKIVNAARYEIGSLKERILLDRKYEKLKQTDAEASGSESETIGLTTRQLFNLAVKEYRPKRLDVTIALFRATETLLIDDPKINDTPLRTTTDDDAFGWRQRTTGDVLVFDVPGGHSSMLQPPNVDTLATELNQCIARALSEPGPADTPAPEPVSDGVEDSRKSA